MKLITLVADMDELGDGPDKQVEQLYNGEGRQLVEVKLRNNAVLAKHTAAYPITVLCVNGAGLFSAGPDLEESQELRTGTLITLEANVEHEVIADPELHLLVSKFKGIEAIRKST